MKWEYKIEKVYVSLLPEAVKEINALGDKGWEAVSGWGDQSLGSFILFKRPK
jgi:hypothetical protein